MEGMQTSCTPYTPLSQIQPQHLQHRTSLSKDYLHPDDHSIECIAPLTITTIQCNYNYSNHNKYYNYNNNNTTTTANNSTLMAYEGIWLTKKPT